MTYRERRMARAERLREWAAKRDQKAEANHRAARTYIDNVPLGQPILVGHHSERRHRREQAKFVGNMDRAIENTAMADRMRERAANIEAAAGRAIYSDDPDAIVRLQARIDMGEKTRTMIREFNASCRKGEPDFSLLDDQMQKNYDEIKRFTPYNIGKRGEFPAYFSSNLSGNISRLRKRLERLQRAAAQ